MNPVFVARTSGSEQGALSRSMTHNTFPIQTLLTSQTHNTSFSFEIDDTHLAMDSLWQC